MDEREKRDVREWSQTSDTRRRRPENNARKPFGTKQTKNVGSGTWTE